MSSVDICIASLKRTIAAQPWHAQRVTVSTDELRLVLGYAIECRENAERAKAPRGLDLPDGDSP